MSCLPCLQDELGSECPIVSIAKDFCEVVSFNTTELLAFKHLDLMSPILLEQCKADDVKALKKMCAMGWVDDDIDVELVRFTKEA